MSNISKWSNTAASNSSAPPDGAPEGMLPSAVNDTMREMMAAMRRYYEAPEFRDFGDTPTFSSANTFTIPTDVTGRYHLNRRIQVAVSTGALYGTIQSVSYAAPNTTITVTLDSGSLDSGLSSVALGPAISGKSMGAKGLAFARPDGTASNVQDELAKTYNSYFSTGDAKITLKNVADIGWIMANDGTIGNGNSSASTRANDDCQALFSLLWNNVSDTYAPVTGGRGASAAADWAASKVIALTKTLGRAIAGAGNGSGLTARPLGSTVGEEAHTQTVNEMPSHGHGVNDPGHSHSTGGDGRFITDGANNSGDASPYAGGALGGRINNTGSSGTGISIQNTGSGQPFNVMQPTSFWNVMIKL